MKLHTKMLCFIAMFFLLTFSLAGCGGTSGGSASVQFAASSSSVAEDVAGGTLDVTVQLNVPGGGTLYSAVTVDVVDLLTGTATSGGTDYTYATPTTVTFIAGSADSATQTVTITLNNDILVEVDETINLQLQTATGSATILVGSENHQVTITDDDSASVQFAASSSSVAEDVAGGTLDVTVQLNVPGGGTLPSAVTIDVVDLLTGTATSGGTDYTYATPTTVTFIAGSADSATQTVTITLNNDILVEVDETINLQLQTATGPATILVGSENHQVTITDDELSYGTFIKTPNLTDDDDDVLPFPSDTTRIQILYPASEISGSGYINELIMFHGFGVATDTTCQNMTVKMGHTSLTTLSATFSTNIEEGHGSFITVIDDANFAIPAGASGDEISIPLETSFHYNGVDNLVVEFTQNTACTQTVDTDRASIPGDIRRVYDLPLDGTPDTATNSQAAVNLIKFVFEGGDNPLFSNPSGNTNIPFTTNPDFQREQQLYLDSDINGSGPITGLGIQVVKPSPEETYTVSVKLGHATVTTLALDYAANYSDSPVTVANAVSFTIPANLPANSYVWIPLPDAVFTYNGTDNLILELDVTAATGDTSYTYHDPPGVDVRLIYSKSDPIDASEINGSSVAIHHSKFRFNGGTMDTITAENTSDTIPFNTTANQRQFLYRASELGTGGTINRLALRATSDSAASDYANFTVMLGHTSLTELTGTFADNMDDATTVFSGLLSIASGLKAGDWIEIPLTSSFTYNGEDNLVVYMSTDGGTANNEIFKGGPDSLYTNRHSYVLDNTSPVASDIDNFLVDQRLWLQ